MTHFLYVVRHGEASPHDGPLSELGRRQADLTGRRLSAASISVIHHGPLPRAAQTAAIIAARLPWAATSESELAGDYIPADPDVSELPASFGAFVSGYDAQERAEGTRLAAAAARQFSGPTGRARAGTSDTHELLVTHNLLIGWLVSKAMAAPDWRWLGTNQMNCGLSVIAYREGEPGALVTFNDGGHLPAELRWTGYPGGLRVPI